MNIYFTEESSDKIPHCEIIALQTENNISPTLFEVYVDCMLEQLKDSGYGCKVGIKYCGCVGFTDNLFVLIPTLFALNKIVDICEMYAGQFDITFNVHKSKRKGFGMKGVAIMPEILNLFHV